MRTPIDHIVTEGEVILAEQRLLVAERDRLLIQRDRARRGLRNASWIAAAMFVVAVIGWLR
jgi:hypothetical protein